MAFADRALIIEYCLMAVRALQERHRFKPELASWRGIWYCAVWSEGVILYAD